MLFGKKIVYLTFSDQVLKILAVQGGSGKPKIIFYDQRTLEPGIVFDDRIIDLIKFKDEVRKFLSTNRENLKTNKIIIGINEQDSFFSSIRHTGSSRDFDQSLTKSLTEILPFKLVEASIHSTEIDHGFYQAVVVKKTLLSDLASIFQGSDFNLLGFFPITVAILNFLAKKDRAYLYVLAEDQTMIFALIKHNAIVFSSTLKLNNEIKDSGKQISKALSEIVKINKDQILKDVYYTGAGADYLTEILKTENYNIINLPLLDKFKAEKSSDLADYSKSLLLATSPDSQFIIRSNSRQTNADVTKEGSLIKPGYLKKLVLVGLTLLVLVTVFYFGSALLRSKDTNKSNNKDVRTSISKIASNSFKPATSSATKEASSEKPKPPESLAINKADLKINVLNGTTTTGLAAQAKDFLVGKGYPDIITGNATTRDYAQTLVRIKSSKKAIENDLTTTLQERYSITVGEALSEAEAYDIIIIIGRK